MKIKISINRAVQILLLFLFIINVGEGFFDPIFAIFIITDAAAEAAVGLGIIIAFFRNRETVLADEMDILKW